MKKSSIYLLGLCLLLCAGCYSPLTREEAAKIHKVEFRPEMDFQMKYRLVGTTAFTNNISDVEENDLTEQLIIGFREELQKRGYQLTDDAETADVIVQVSPGRTNNQNNMGGIEGMGFHVRVIFGLNPGITAQAEIITRVLDPKTGEIISLAEVNRYALTDVTNAVDEWEEFSLEEKQELIGTLKEQMLSVPAESLNAVGLVDRHNPPPPDPKYVMPPASPKSRGG